MIENVDGIMDVARRVIGGEEITPDEASRLIHLEDQADIHVLISWANRIRTVRLNNQVEMCAIVNAKSGLCSENCAFCAQSSHYNTSVSTYPLMSAEEIVSAGRKAVQAGAYRFSIVTSGKGVLNKGEMEMIMDAVKALAQEGIRTCASLGLMSEETAAAFKEAGLLRYHHNLETAASYYPDICTTHGFEERVNTVLAAYRSGLEVCSGGILGMGETREQRLELAFQLKELPVVSIPLNFLNPIPGTPLENQTPLHPLEILKTIAVFRFILPDREIRTCGGREANLRGLQPLMFTAGCSGTMIGNYLTTEGRDPAQDAQDIRDLGLRPKR